MNINRRNVAVLGVTLALAAPSCAGDAPMAPPTGLAPLSATASFIGSGTITISTDQGSYTINTATSELTGPGGRLLMNIPTDVVAELATTFQHIVDDPATQFENALAADKPIADDPSPPPQDNLPDNGTDCGNECATYRAGPPSRTGPRATTRPQLHDRRTTRRGVFKPAAFRGTAMTLTTTRRFGYCNDLALKIYGHSTSWKNAKQAYFDATRDWLELYFGLAQIRTWDDAARYITAHLRMQTAGYIIAREGATLDILAMDYDRWDCWNMDNGHWSPTSSAKQTMPGPSMGGSTTQYGWVCKEVMILDEDGWPIGVKSVCEYMFAA